MMATDFDLSGHLERFAIDMSRPRLMDDSRLRHTDRLNEIITIHSTGEEFDACQRSSEGIAGMDHNQVEQSIADLSLRGYKCIIAILRSIAHDDGKGVNLERDIAGVYLAMHRSEIDILTNNAAGV